MQVRANHRIALRNIVFLTDFSEPSGAALPYAAMIARAYGAKVTALHVMTPTAYPDLPAQEVAELIDVEEDLAKAEMDKVSAALAGLPSETLMERGADVWEVLSRTLEERQVDLIALGTHGRTGVKKALLGSSAEQVFRRTQIPVMTIGPRVREGAHSGGRFRCVLFASELNSMGGVAAPYAVSLAQENQARLVLLHVLPSPRAARQSKQPGISVAEALHRLEELVPPDAELWCKPEPLVEHGEPAAQILVAAKRFGADLIVLAVRGLREFASIPLRPERATAYEVVANAPCPVLTVRG